MSDADAIAEQPKPPNQPPDPAAPCDTKPAPKNIVVCCDGTGNEFNGCQPEPRDTDGNSNVVKLYTALDLSVCQYAYYHPGVGTMGDPSKKGLARWWSKVKGMAFGSGFLDNVLDAYRYLMQHYNAGDQVYIFGFSRGAYTARALAGFLHGYGLLCRGNEGHILYAWNLYTAKLKKHRGLDEPPNTVETDFAFRDTFSHQDFTMRFIGLWDTVSSVGWITTPLRLLHLAQNPSIRVGRHAVSIDERRCFYHDNLWGDPAPVQVPPILQGTPRGNEMAGMQDIEQVWFPGVHSDVGGSYGQYSSGLSNRSLEWMMDQAEAAGARFDPKRRDAVLGNPVTGDPHGLTATPRALYPKPTSNPVHPSLVNWWWALEVFPHRYYNTDQDPKEILRIPWGAWRRLPDGALLHSEVLQRLKDPQASYAPPNLTVGKIVPIAMQTPAGIAQYGRFSAPPPHAGWRQNLLLVFAVKVLLTSIPVLILRPLLLWIWRLAERYAPAPLHSTMAAVWHCLLRPGWVARLEEGLGHFAGHLGWSLAVAAVVVLSWTLFRLIKPRA